MRCRYALSFGRGAHSHALRAKAAAAGFLLVEEADDMLLAADCDTSFLTSPGSVLIGQLFTPAGDRAHCLPDAAALQGAAPFPSGWWGNYVRFDSSASGRAVQRDPSGAVPVYRCAVDTDSLFVSDAAIARDLGLVSPEVDGDFLTAFLQFPFLRTARTGIAGVEEVVPGTTLRQERNGRGWSCRLWWRPSAFAGYNERLTDPLAAARELRDLALRLVPLQLEDRVRPVALQLSGGLDSAIVACCLASASIPVAALNFATRSSEGDERRFAAAVADRLRLTLTEIGEEPMATIPAIVGPSFRPASNPLLQPLEDAIQAAALALNCGCLVDGAGGDNLFCHLTTAAPVLDALVEAGPRQALRTIADVGTRANTGWWQVLAAAARRIRRRPVWTEDRSFLNSEALLDQRDRHPWLEDSATLHPGQRAHVEALVHIQHFLGRGTEPLDRSHPLMAQPLLELCLRIPSWRWVGGGRDRAIARQAFAGRLPATILRRRTKGSLQGMFARAFAMLLPEIRERLLTGRLARRNLLDLHALEEATRDATRLTGPHQLRLSEMLALELWLADCEEWRPAGRA